MHKKKIDEIGTRNIKSTTISTSCPINSRTGNFMKTRIYNPETSEPEEVDDIINFTENKKMKKKIKEETTLNPERDSEYEKEPEVADADIQLFQNISRDTATIANIVSDISDTLTTNKGRDYDSLVTKLKRAFEPLVVTVQRLPDHVDDLGKGSEQPNNQMQQPEDTSQQDMNKKLNMPSTGGATPLDQATSELDKETGDEDSMKDLKKNTLKEDLLNEKKKHQKTEKIALKSPSGRIVWVLRKLSSKYMSKGYKIAPNSSKKVKGKKKAKRAFKESLHTGVDPVYTGSGTHNIMRTDQQELVDEQNCDKRYIMRGPDNKTYAVKASAAEKYVQKGYKLERDTQTQMPKYLKVNEAKIKALTEKYTKIAEEELDSILESIAKKLVKAEIKSLNLEK
jgi:hypothetical protein